MPIQAGTITLHLLTESKDGSWVEFPIGAEQIGGVVAAGEESDAPTHPLTFESIGGNRSEFTAKVPEILGNAEKLRISLSDLTLGTEVHQFEFDASR